MNGSTSLRPSAPASVEERFVVTLQSVLPESRPLALHEPLFRGHESQYVQECISTGWVSSVGKFVDRFERDLADFTGARHAVVVVNGTAALHMALHLAGVGSGDEVLVPALSFVATANAVSHTGATPHFVDSEERSLGMDSRALREHLLRVSEKTATGLRNRITGRRLAALVPMHAFGHPADIDGLLGIAHDFELPLIEDAAESLGSYHQGHHTGTFGLCGALSFNGNKILTTGAGGALLVNDSEVARKAKHITTTAKQPHRWSFFHDEVAWNYRMPNLNAALGCAQLEQLPSFLDAKRKLAQRYQQAFANDPNFIFVAEPEGCKSNYWLNTVRLKQPSIHMRDRVLAHAHDNGLLVRPIWQLLNTLPMYRGAPTAPLPVAEQLENSVINLPSGVALHTESGA